MSYRHRDDRGGPGMAALDFQQGLIILFFVLFVLVVALISVKTKAKPTIGTMGAYAITTQWKKGSNDDVDLYVQDPRGHVVYFGSPSVDLMHLEHDDLGTKASSYDANGNPQYLSNGERVVLRGTEKGEYTVNVHLYDKADPGPIRIKITLWRLAGNDRVEKVSTVVLVHQADERTVFRFTLNSNGQIVGYNTIQKDLVSAAGMNNNAP